MAELGIASSVIAIVDISAKIASLCFQYSKAVKHARDDIERLSREVSNLETVSTELNELLKSANGTRLRCSHELTAAVGETDSDLKKLRQLLEQGLNSGKVRKAMSRCGIRALRWPLKSKDADAAIQKVRHCVQLMSNALQIDQTKMILSIDEMIILDRLPVAEGASFNSKDEARNPQCLANTRVELLNQIMAWVKSPDAKPIFWLNGQAGTGKSTISRTICHSLSGQSTSQSSYLGASFFFKRGETDRGQLAKFFTTIARRLVVSEPSLASFVKDAIEADPDLIHAGFAQQFQELIFKPLSKSPRVTSADKPLILVIDALDECDNADDMKCLIGLLADLQKLPSGSVKAFLTSRPDLPIRLGFHAKTVTGTYEHFILHQVTPSVIEHDISTFLEHALHKIRDDYNLIADGGRELPSDWPGQTKIKALVSMAVPLFISAATACLFIEERKINNPDARLQKVLKFKNKSAITQLAKTYLPVLEQQTEGLSLEDRAEVIDKFRYIIGTIVLLSSPLSVVALGAILNVSQQSIMARLDWLHAVLEVPSSRNVPVRMLHLSFRDFLVDPANRSMTALCVDETQGHSVIVENCLRLMKLNLRRDVCDIRAPGTPRTAIPQQKLAACLPPEVQYACQYWLHHWKESKVLLRDGDFIHSFLTSHLLYWLEALSLMGRISESVSMIDDLIGLLAENSDGASAFLRDARRVILSHHTAIDRWPLQVYISALVFAPKNSIIRNTFKNELPAWLFPLPMVNLDWDLCAATLEGHNDWVPSVAFSPDGSRVASGSRDRTVKLWDAATGACTATLEGHDNWVQSVAFSPDGSRVASGSRDRTVKLWDAATGACTATLEGHDWRHDGPVQSVAFSPDGSRVASASNDQTVKLWDAATGACTATLEGHDNWVQSVAFSPDGSRVASGSYDQTVKLWDAATGACTATLEGHDNWVQSVAFSPDGSRVASGSYDWTVKLWDAATGACTATLEGHDSWVLSVAFSPDGSRVASGSRDRTVKLWDAATGACTATLEGHDNWVQSVAFSPDGSRVASGSQDRTVKLWDAATGACTATLEGHDNWVLSVAFSPDGSRVASGSDRTVKLWDAATGACTATLEGHDNWTQSVAFSPDGKLYTDTGMLMPDGLVNSSGSMRTINLQSLRSGVGLSQDREWILWDSSSMMWLPPTYRPSYSTVAESVMCMGCMSGRVFLITISPKKLHDLSSQVLETT